MKLYSSPIPKSKTKVGRPQRKISTAVTDTFGRVSVYCVGDSINIKELRAHVFRRGFGTNKELTNSSQTSLVLTRSSALENEDDEVLHVSNAPLFITIDTSPMNPFKAVSDIDISLDEDTLRDKFEGNINSRGGELDSSREMSDGSMWGTKEAILMATQGTRTTELLYFTCVVIIIESFLVDIFYFDYGAVVFWGLTVQEEKAAMTGAYRVSLL